MTHPLATVPRRAARWSATHPWRAIGAWFAFVAVAVALASFVPTVEADDADYRLGESGRAATLVEAVGLDEPGSENVLVTGTGSTDLDATEAEGAAADLAQALAGVDGVAAVAGPQWSPDRSALLVPARLARDGDLPDTLADDVRRVVGEVADTHPGLEVRAAGDTTLDAAVDERVGEDLHAAEGISLPITLVLMLLAFGALVAAGLPVLLAATSVAATIGVLAPLSHLVPAESTVTSMVVLIGMAVGVDYSLFYLKREREERLAGRTTLDAVDIAAQTSGHSILVSGGAVIAAMAGLFLVGDVTFNSLAVGSILVVAVAVLGSITVLPALLAGLGRWVDRPRVPLLWRLNARIGAGGISTRILRPVVRRPLAALILASVVVVGLALPALGLRIHSANLDTLPASIPEVQTMRDLTAAFPAEGASATVVVKADPADAGRVADALADLEQRAVATGDFVATGEAPEASADGTTTVLDLAMPFDESDERVDDAVRELRTELVPASFAGDGATQLDAETAVGGGAAESLDFADRLGGRLPLVIGFVLLLTCLMMLLTFRSVVLAGVSVLLNLASVGVAFGCLVLVFQHGVGADLLGFTNPGFVIDWLPLFVLVVLVGLSMDYHVFVLSRIREHVLAGLDPRVAVQRGISETAGVVTSAAAVMVSVFAIFATLSMLEMKMMGVGLAAAILLDATLVRLVMLPAILVLLGDRVWPRRTTPAPVAVVPTDAEVEDVRPATPSPALR
ncbi:MMPL family transporter [Nocardioides sp.]|uniref:MMPL family transporter n=1 Tax=Nocardioides sp. TaxID=35761 RepID=UPI002721A4CD|nr:MMPL family transporter [Nocardioides sp.]MDO9456968.1 MMPL family transporter [Nocardioides sp.]